MHLSDLSLGLFFTMNTLLIILVASQYQQLLTSSKCSQLFQQFFPKIPPCNSEI